ncbi:MAG: HpaII family restriction endonuclease [Muribaculaceae bacterium]|nr:HpaII family restriction endonuclease [Muribaculaceae bacterium]
MLKPSISFLLAYAIGLTASKVWQGKLNANGGSIVVK